MAKMTRAPSMPQGFSVTASRQVLADVVAVKVNWAEVERAFLQNSDVADLHAIKPHRGSRLSSSNDLIGRENSAPDSESKRCRIRARRNCRSYKLDCVFDAAELKFSTPSHQSLHSHSAEQSTRQQLIVDWPDASAASETRSRNPNMLVAALR